MMSESAHEFTTVEQRTAVVAALPPFLYCIGGPAQIGELGVDFSWHDLAITVSFLALVLLVCTAGW